METISLVADDTAKSSGRDHEFQELALWREPTVRSEDFSRELQGEPEGPQSTESKDDAEARKGFWSIQGDFIYRHHNVPRVQLHAPKEESFPIPLKFIDVTRSTCTNLSVKQEKLIDDYWNINGSRDLSDSWTGYAQFTVLDEKPPDGYMWSGERLTKRQATSRPDHLWPELWTKLGRNAKLREKQKWSHEKLHLDNARKLRGFYFIDPEDREYTNLDVLQEKRVNDYWNVDANRSLSDSVTGFTKFALLKEKPPEGYMSSGGRLTKIQATTRPDNVWPGIYFIDPEDGEYKEAFTNARRKLGVPMDAAMPCKKGTRKQCSPRK